MFIKFKCLHLFCISVADEEKKIRLFITDCGFVKFGNQCVDCDGIDIALHLHESFLVIILRE